MTNELLKEEILKDEQLEQIAGGIELPKRILLKRMENNSAQAIVIGDFIPPAKAFVF